MDFIIEILIELIMEGTFELSQTKKTPNWLRYPLIAIIAIIFIGVISIIFITAYLSINEYPAIAISLFVLGLVFAISAVYKFKSLYFKRDPNSQSSKIWNKFIEQICPQKISDLNDIQKNAVLCFYYDREMNIGGHVCYFDNYQKVNNEDLKEALRIVANKKYVNNFEEALNNGKEDNYQKTDSVYKKLNPCLTEYIEEYVLDNQEIILQEKTEKF